MSWLGNSPDLSLFGITPPVVLAQGQTAVNLVYAAGRTVFVRNGTVMSPPEYTAADGQVLNLTKPANKDDIVFGIQLGSFSVANAISNLGGSMIGALALAAGSTSVTPDPADASSKIATTEFVTGRLINVQVFPNPGTFTYTPTPGMRSVITEAQGGGGGGGGAAATASNMAAGGGGASGSYGKGRFTAAQVGASQLVTIGAAGVGGAATGNAGGTGGTTSFGTLLSAPGGYGGNFGTAAAAITTWGGSPGAAPTGANIISTRGIRGLLALGQGGPSGGLVAGDGAGSPIAGGGGGGLATAGAAQEYGAGGAGGANTGTSPAIAGGPGMGGIIIVMEFA